MIRYGTLFPYHTSTDIYRCPNNPMEKLGALKVQTSVRHVRRA